jgi:uncharacterized surface protein with fasciclin (FAS1) repeats
MKILRYFWGILLTMATLHVIIAAADDSREGQPSLTRDPMKHQNTDIQGMKSGLVTILDMISADPNFGTLMKALTAANLLNTLKSPGPFTLLAPNDQAFAKLPLNTVSDLLKPENKQKLLDLLSYHIIPGKVTSSELKSNALKALNANH